MTAFKKYKIIFEFVINISSEEGFEFELQNGLFTFMDNLTLQGNIDIYVSTLQEAEFLVNSNDNKLIFEEICHTFFQNVKIDNFDFEDLKYIDIKELFI